MSSDDEAVRVVPLGRTFTLDVPLGPAGDLALTGFASATGRGKVHGDQSCGALRSATAVRRVESRFRDTLGRLCTNCSWPLPAGSPILKLGASVVDIDSLKVWIGREPDSLEDQALDEDAAMALAAGEYPPDPVGSSAEGIEEDGSKDEFDHEAWDRYERARAIRHQHHVHWRRLQSYMLRSNEAVAAHPFLRSWAEPLQAELAKVIDAERRSLTAMLQPAALLDAAGVPLVARPTFMPGPQFATLGGDAPKVFAKAWSEWSHQAQWSWHRLEDNSFAVSSVVRDAIGRRRKGRDEAVSGFEGLVEQWIASARREASRYDDEPRQLLAVGIPGVARDQIDGRDRDPLTRWEGAVIATYQIAVNWPNGTIALLAPRVVADHLIAGATRDLPVERLGTGADALPAEALLSGWTPEKRHDS